MRWRIDEHTEWVHRVDIDRWWRFALPAAAIGCAVCGLVAAWSLLAGQALVPEPLVFPLFFGVFPVHVCTLIWWFRRRAAGPSAHLGFRDVLQELTTGWRVLLGAVMALFVLAPLLTAPRLRGGPVERDGRYFLNSHGELTEVSRDDYLRHQSYSQVTFTAFPGLFYAAGVGAGIAQRRRPSESDSS